jgi:hypothetical protein
LSGRLSKFVPVGVPVTFSEGIAAEKDLVMNSSGFSGDGVVSAGGFKKLGSSEGGLTFDKMLPVLSDIVD